MIKENLCTVGGNLKSPAHWNKLDGHVVFEVFQTSWHSRVSGESASNNWTQCNQQRRKWFLTRTKGIQLITASSITVSKHLTQQLMYELQQFHCSCQHQKGDTKIGNTCLKTLPSGYFSWLQRQIRAFLDHQLRKQTDVRPGKTKVFVCSTFWWYHHVSWVQRSMLSVSLCLHSTREPLT